MNQLNVWIRLEQMDEENPRFEEFMKLMNIEDRGEVSQQAALCAFKIFPGGCAVRFNKQILGTTRKAIDLLKFAKINIDVLLFDDYFHTELNCIFLFQRKLDGKDDSLCAHCYHELSFDHKSKTVFCSRCDFKKEM